MQTRLRSKISLLFVVCAVLLAIPAVALADDISNNLDTSVDAVAEVMPLTVGGANGTTQLYLVERNGDGKNGCNLTGGTSLGLSVSSNNASVATVSPSSVTFTSCGDIKNLTVTPHNAGTATISVSQASNNTGATFNLAPATFTVNVTNPTPPNTAPTVTVAGVTGGASYNKGSVPAATCQVTDTEDGNSSFPATLSAISGPYASDGIGEQTASCSYTDAGGLTAAASETYGIVDPSPPVIGYTLNPASPDGSNDWYKSDVTLTWNVSEPQSPNSLEKTGCVDQNITADQAATVYSCSATSAGGTSNDSVTIKRDATPPGITLGGVSGTAGANGWYTSAVTQTFNANDATSGVVGPTSIPVSSGAAEGDGVMIASGAVSDKAGNSNPGINAGPFKVDLHDPTNVAFVGGPAAGGSYDFGNVPAAPTCMADDDVSGLQSPNGCVVTGYSNAVGSHTMTAKATDNAGRTATLTRTYTVAAYRPSGFYQPVDMNDTVNTVKNGLIVPVKFELFQSISGTELQSTSAISSILAKSVNCAAFNGDPIDEIETLAPGSTSLRYDATAGQFIYNWQTPKGASQVGKCYSLTMSSADNSSTLVAYFKLK